MDSAGEIGVLGDASAVGGEANAGAAGGFSSTFIAKRPFPLLLGTRHKS